MKKINLFFLAVIIPLLCVPRAKAASSCAIIDKTIGGSVAEYVAAKYHIMSVSQLSLIDSSQANLDCYWKFEFEVLSSRQKITLYLTPDHKYLVPAIYDRNADPLIVEKQAREEALRVLTAGHAASEGPKTSSVTIVEFSDFQCPYCQRLTAMLEKEVLPNDPDVQVFFRNFPLPMHPWAQIAAEVAECAELQSDAAFWKMHDYIFQNQHDLTVTNLNEKLLAVADAEPGLNRDTFRACVDQRLTMGPVSKDIELGKRFDVHATPTIFINGSKVEGIHDIAQLKQLIAQARSGQMIPEEETQRVASMQPATTLVKGTACAPAN